MSQKIIIWRSSIFFIGYHILTGNILMTYALNLKRATRCPAGPARMPMPCTVLAQHFVSVPSIPAAGTHG